MIFKSEMNNEFCLFHLLIGDKTVMSIRSVMRLRTGVVELIRSYQTPVA